MAIGLMLSTVGMDPLGGVGRFTFGFTSAQGGLSFIAITTGLFGVAEVLALMAEGDTRVEMVSVRFRELYPNRDELKRSLTPILRGGILGFLVGLIPGPAATIASFVSYGVERRFSKHKEEFGKGAIFKENEKINLEKQTIKSIIQKLEKYYLSATSADIKGWGSSPVNSLTFDGGSSGLSL